MKLAIYFAALVATSTTLASTCGHSGMAKRATDYLSSRGPQRLDQVRPAVLSLPVHCADISRSRTRSLFLDHQNNKSRISSLDNETQPSPPPSAPESRRRSLHSRLRKQELELELECVSLFLTTADRADDLIPGCRPWRRCCCRSSCCCCWCSSCEAFRDGSIRTGTDRFYFAGRKERHRRSYRSISCSQGRQSCSSRCTRSSFVLLP